MPAVHDVREQWNLLTAYELYTGTLLKVPDLVFMLGELERDKPEISVKRPDQYRVAYMKLLSSKRQKVENPDSGGGSPGAQGATQAVTAEIVDSSSTTPEKQVIGAGGNEGAGATPPQNLAGGTDVPVEEDGTTSGMELLSLQEEPLGLNRDNLRWVRKRKGAPKWVRKLSKMVETMAKNSAEEVPMGVIAQEMWDVIMELDKDGRRLLKDEAKNRKQREREKKKKAKAKAKKRAKKEQNRRKQESRQKAKQADTDSSDDSSTSSDSSDSTSWDSSSDSSADSDSSSDKDRKNKSRDGGGRDGTLKPRRGRSEDFDFRWINGHKHFRTNKGTWQDCTNPPSRLCIFCGNRH